ncbi:CinA family protein [Streptomyces sp. E11-3]|uniref:CinA family protein n=1 Tax=Streptomyces sp. E11-3 TaxID=3110112 RepID=UPI003981001C
MTSGASEVSEGAGASAARAAEVLELLVGRGETLAVAESLTGGLVAAELTGVAGASKCFRGSVTAYATELKERLLGVDGTLLVERGAVDAEVARQMAQGVRRVLGADWGIATTGVAGPEPQDGQPVGTVYVAVAGPGGAQVEAAEVAAGADPAAGPAGGMAGTISGVADSGGLLDGKVAQLRLNGSRAEIRRESVRSVLALLAGELTKPSSELITNVRAQDTEQHGGI